MSIRLFVALELPEDIRGGLAAVGRAASAAEQSTWRPVPRESLHITLAFLGSRDAGDVATIDSVVAAQDGEPAPRLALAAPMLLPPRRARVLAVAVEDLDGILAPLQRRIAEGLAAAGVFEPETRPFRPHVTVARLRARAVPPRSVDAAPDPTPFTATRLTLYRSELHRTGARYVAVASANLAG